MGDADYQLALVLQRQLEQEQKPPNHSENDYILALRLQEQFEQEQAVEKPNGNLVYEKKTQPNKDNTKSLVDPSWEVIDPTPDIRILFLAFNERFFWGKLLAVCVDWSKRMTTCAGVCSYSAQGGMCKITLSEPLLKLRPRKDLVETLLHEMIHALLFVTNNYQDRESHGPEFLKHMHRINKESGTNITVYHSFHDEVRLYQQHWWRCDGPCHKRKPFFGMVRRATNRAPGPNDFWWAEHSRNCGGTFIKVKEPEKQSKKKTQKENIPTPAKKTKNDIRNYIPVLGTQNRNAGTKTKTVVIPSTSTSASSETSSTSTSANPNSNIHGFSSTFYDNKPKNAVNASTSTNNVGNTSKSTAGTLAGSTGVLGGTKPKASDYSMVRNHWLNKFENGTLNNKRTSSGSFENNSKKPKLSVETNVDLSKQSKSNSDDFVSCPVCNNRFPSSDINVHLDSCLSQQIIDEEQNKERANGGKNGLERHDSVNGDSTFDFELNMVQCDVCSAHVDENKMESHLRNCLQSMIADSEPVEVGGKEEEMDYCPICETHISKPILEQHLESCVFKKYGNIAAKHDKPKAKDGFPNRKSETATTSRLDGNRPSTSKGNDVPLEDDVIDDREEVGGPNNDSVQYVFEVKNDDEDLGKKKYTCPFCMGRYPDNEMNEHLDACLVTEDYADCLNRSIAVDEMVNNDL